ncbi:protein PERCC1-like [Saccostrea echinata]|uniref:protein PERCC1-like n=1 Tax=Saccostrea echinata TaxID=191078 RepID=UPI002A7F6BFA|nr:protein PERCC1-like [Saccostrea echinata]XP_061175003.1 protein PERCC1-like [Saccostrea echinata]XP_061175004.1 protein PERCC1-like [Saccostrea echinata]
MHFSTLPRINGNEAAMTAVQTPRMSQMHGPDLHQTVIKRPFEPLTKAAVETFDKCIYNKMDDDDFSDHDSHYSEDLMDDSFDIPLSQGPDMTQQLLNFADMVNSDIQKFFGKKKDEDSCDIYEDKWVTTKSGRELYYADLLRIAQGENVDTKNTKELLTLNNASQEKKDNKHKFSGKLDTKVGLGPLEDLFRYGLKDFISDKKKSKKLRRMQADVKKYSDLTPMNRRKLPQSFWQEPGGTIRTHGKVNGNGAPIINSSQPPDFSDLLHSWTRCEEEDYSGGDMSSSEISVASTESTTMEQL